MEYRRNRPTENRTMSDSRLEQETYGMQYDRSSQSPAGRRTEWGTNPSPRRGRPEDRRETSAEPPRRRRPEDRRETSAESPRRGRPEDRREPSAEPPRRRRPEDRRETSAESPRRRRPEDGRETSTEPPRQRRSTGSTGTDGRSKGTSHGSEKRKPADSAVLTERAMRAAKKREAIRAENARLHRLRRQQKRQAKRRTVKRINKGLFKRLIVMVGVILAVLFSMVIFFRVENIQVQGASYYSQEEILQACGVATGDNLLTLSRGKISGSIMAPLKYVESVKVSRQLPNTLIIHVTESRPRYAVQDTDGNYYLMTAQGKIVEQISTGSAKEYTMVEELLIHAPAIGEDIQIFAEAGNETKAKGQLTAMKGILTALEEATLGRHIASVQIPSSFKISLWYEDRFFVELGNTTRIDYKLEYLKTVVRQEESYVTGTIDLTLRDGDKAILLRGD